MSKDYTLAVDELRRHYIELTVLKKTVRAQVKAEYEAKIDFEINRRIEAEEIKFANHLAAVKERESMPVSIIQDHVLRTRTWSRWEKWRDLAGLSPELVTAEDARAAKRAEEAVYVWTDTELIVKRNTLGVVLDPPVVYPVSTIRQTTAGKLWIADATDEAYEAEVMRSDADNYVFMRALSAEIARHHAEQEKG